MLRLSRKLEPNFDTFWIGKTNRIVLLGVFEKRATVGFDFPDDVLIEVSINPEVVHPIRETGKMFAVTMEPENSVIIGNEITCVITSIESEKVGFGINAPKKIRVERGELRLRPDYKEGWVRTSPQERR